MFVRKEVFETDRHISRQTLHSRLMKNKAEVKNE